MQKLICFLTLLVVFYSCSTDNTDVQVDQNVNPVQAKVVIDTIPPKLDTLLFNKLALDCFFHLGYTTGGEFYYKSAIESIHHTIIQILEDHGDNGSDIVFLIDKTGSMQNDIDSVRINLNAIIDQIEQLKDVRLCAASYGDKNVDGPTWWSSTTMTNDYSLIRKYINNLSVSDGGDYPESVYDGLANVLKKTNWRKNSKKMVLVIGDAPSLEDSLSGYSRKQIIDLCTKEGVKVNLFPILVTPMSAKSFIDQTKYSEKIVKKVFPNPATDKINVQMVNDDSYVLTMMELSGKVVLEQAFSGPKLELQIPAEIKNGTYILRIYNPKDYNMFAEKIMIER